MSAVQELIHELEVGGGLRWLRTGLTVVAVLLLGAGYNWRAFRNLNTPEAMDAAQLARNIAQGKGFTTLFVRPFSFYLIKSHDLAKHQREADPGRLKGMHPDIANPPVYPLALAGLMKVLPFYFFSGASKKPLPAPAGAEIYKPDLFIGLFNQLLLLAVAICIFFLARRLFDRSVAWYSASLVLGAELLWHFSVSGLSTMLLLVIFVGLAWCLVRLEQEAREPIHGSGTLLAWAALAGALTGLGGLTRYAFAWLILVVLLFLILFGGKRRLLLALLALSAFVGVLSPWIARNWSLSGTPLGTAGYTVAGPTLQRSVDLPQPRLVRYVANSAIAKMRANLPLVIQNDLPKLGGNWVSAFFLVGLMVGFRNPSARRLRYFILGCLVTLVLVQAALRTQLSEEVPDVSADNLLVLLTPLALMYGVSLFLLLLEQLRLPIRELRHIVVGLFVIVACLPMLFTLSNFSRVNRATAPYDATQTQAVVTLVGSGDLTMSDIPWAVAWYGGAQSMWLTLNAAAEFLAINDYQKPIDLVYLSEQTTNSRFLTQWWLPGETGWGNLMFVALQEAKAGRWPKQVDLVLRGQMQEPIPFPLHYWQPGWPYLFLLTARELPPKKF